MADAKVAAGSGALCQSWTKQFISVQWLGTGRGRINTETMSRRLEWNPPFLYPFVLRFSYFHLMCDTSYS